MHTCIHAVTAADILRAMSASPLRIFCGADRSQQLPFQVLAASIRRHASQPIDIRPIDNSLAPPAPDPRFAPYTEFSFARFAIPALCEFKGRALYMDSDMLVFADIAELFRLPFDDARVLIERGADLSKGKQAAVMMLDCERLNWNVNTIIGDLGHRYGYNALMSLGPLLGPDDIRDDLPNGWNDLDMYRSGVTRNLHFTEIRIQPWVHPGHPHGGLWVRALKELLECGDIQEHDLREEITQGFLRPSILRELGLAKMPTAATPAALLDYDRAQGFVPNGRLLARFAERKRADAARKRDEAIAQRPWLAPWYRLRHRLRYGTGQGTSA